MSPETEALRNLIRIFLEMRARSEESREHCERTDNQLGLAYFEGKSDTLETCILHVRQTLQTYPQPQQP